MAQSLSNPSGQPLPRFATTRSEPVNVRVGPGTQYDVAWVYVKEGQPVEIFQEFDTWRKIRDVDGDEGWVHQNLLSGRRAGLVTPLVGNKELAMRNQPDETSRVRAWLAAGFRVSIESCEDDWCEIRASVSNEEGRLKTYSGFIERHFLWGTYPDENFR